MIAWLTLLAQAPRLLADVPFERHDGQIWVSGKLLTTPIHAIVDTGAGASTMDDRIGTRAGVIKTRRLEFGGNGPNTVAGWVSKGLDVAFEGTELTTPVFHGLPLRKLFQDFAHPLGAILGFELFKPNVVAIDYAASRLRFYAPEGYRPPPGFESIEIQLIDRIPTAFGTLRLPGLEERRVVVAFDTGSAFGVDVEGWKVRRDKLDQHYKELPVAENTGGLGGAQKTRAVGPADVRLGGLTLSGAARLILSRDPKVRRPLGFDYDSDVTLGDAVLSRYTFILDYPHSRIYMKPIGKI